MSQIRRVKVKILKDSAGQVLCSCGCGQLVKPPRRNWYSDACVEKWKSFNDPGYIRRQLKERDKGICVICGCDADKELKRWQEAEQEIERMLGWFTSHWRIHGYQWDDRRRRWLPNQDREIDWKEVGAWRKKTKKRWSDNPGFNTGDVGVGRRRRRRSGWDADHIIPVIEGGGLCTVDGYRTACQPCHKRATAELAKRRALRRIQEAIDS